VHNQNPKPFIWTVKANDILQKVIRANRRLSSKEAAGLDWSLARRAQHNQGRIARRTHKDAARRGVEGSGQYCVTTSPYRKNVIKTGEFILAWKSRWHLRIGPISRPPFFELPLSSSNRWFCHRPPRSFPAATRRPCSIHAIPPACRLSAAAIIADAAGD
jgi:hypothetical protein